jgi:outer membrane protein assembly factor BamB
VPAGAGYAAPVVAGGRVFLFSRVGEEETLQALDLASGRSVWRQGYPAPYQMNSFATAHGKGPKATPLVAAGRVFALGIDGVLSAHDAATGRLLWRKSFAGEFPETAPLYGSAQSPVADGDRVIVHVGGPGKGALTAFQAATGAAAWSWRGDGPAYASPVVAEIAGVRQVVALSETMLVGVAADSGRLLWKTPFTTEYVQNAVTPVVQGDVVVFSGLDHPVKAVRVARRGADWAVEPVWENADVALYMSSPVLSGGRVFGLSHRRKGQFFCLDAASGKTLWLSEGRQGENAALVVAGRTIIALTTEGELLLADAGASTFQVLRRYPVASAATWAHVAVVSEGVLVKDADSLSYLRF